MCSDFQFLQISNVDTHICPDFLSVYRLACTLEKIWTGMSIVIIVLVVHIGRLRQFCFEYQYWILIGQRQIFVQVTSSHCYILAAVHYISCQLAFIQGLPIRVHAMIIHILKLSKTLYAVWELTYILILHVHYWYFCIIVQYNAYILTRGGGHDIL